MPDPLFWEVVLANGTMVREPAENASIRTAPKGATELRVVDGCGNVIHRLALTDERGRAVRPIFYRRRYQDRRIGGAAGESRLGATVFGWGRENGSSVEGFVWTVAAGQVVECPPSLRDSAMIERQITRQEIDQ